MFATGRPAPGFVVAAVGQAPPPEPVGPLPDIAAAISGGIYEFGPNDAGVETLSLEFDGSAEAMLHIRFTGADETVLWPIGLDGVYRQSLGGQWLRGSWADPETFMFQLFDPLEVGRSSFRLRFEEDRLEVSSPEQALFFAGRLADT